jgi:hypothetical protein
MSRRFIVSSGVCVGRDAVTGQGIFMGTANITSSFTTSTTAQEVRAGVGNPLLYVYYHSKKVDVKIEDATFNPAFLAMNSGQLSTTGTVTGVYTDCITLSNGTGTLTNYPVSDVCVFMSDNSIQNITPVGKTITVVGGASQSVTAVYDYSVTAERTIVYASVPPMLCDLVIIAEERDDTRTLINHVQFHIPRFQVSGNNTFSLAASGVATSTLEGMALAVADTTCAGGDYFATITRIPVASSSVATSAIVALPGALTFPSATLTTQTLKALALRGSATADVTTSASFTSSGSNFVTGLHTGTVMISASAAIVGISGSVVIAFYDSVSGSTLTDSVSLTVV